MRKLFLFLSVLALAGCDTLTINVLSNNNVLTTRSQATGVGDQEALVEGGGSPNISATAIP